MNDGEQASNQPLSCREEEGTEFSPSGSVNFQFGESLPRSEGRYNLEVILLRKPSSTHLASQPRCPFFCVPAVPMACFHDDISKPGCFPLVFDTSFSLSTELCSSVCPSGLFSMHLSLYFSQRNPGTVSGKKLIAHMISESIYEKQEI